MIIEKDLGNIKIILNQEKTSFTKMDLLTIGSKSEPIRGLTHFLEHMWFNGTQKYSSLELSQKIEFLGGNLNAYTAPEKCGFSLSCLTNDFKESFSMFESMILEPKFTQENLEKEVQVITSEIQNSETEEFEAIWQAQHDHLFDQSLNPLGTRESIRTITLQDLEEAHKELWNGTHKKVVCFITSGTDIEYFADLLANLNEKLGQVQPNLVVLEERNKDITVLVDENSSKRIEVSGITDCFMSLFEVKLPNIKSNICMDLIKSVLSNGMSSTVFQKTRIEKSLCYHSGISFSYFGSSSFFYVYGLSEKEKLNELETTLFECFQEDITEYDFTKAMNSVKVSEQKLLENPTGYHNKMISQYYSLGSVITKEDLKTTLLSINLEDVNNLLATLRNPKLVYSYFSYGNQKV